MPQKPVVLITGGAGYIGSHAVLSFLDAGFGVVVVDDLSNGKRPAVGGGAEFIQADVGDVATVSRLMASKNFAAVVHFVRWLFAAV